MTSAFLRYTALRIALFGACLALASLLGWFSLEGVVVSILVSAALSWFFLRAPREELARDIADKIDHRVETRQGASRASRWDLDDAAEDAEVARADELTGGH